MEKKLKLVTYITLICISFICGFLICDYFSETETKVIFSGGKLYYNEDGSEKDISSEHIENQELEKTQAAYKINLNTATKEELMDLPSIGEKTAEKIMAYRINTPFKNISEIMNVSGIGESTFEKIKDYIYID